jgi:hypothetical protein
MPLKTRPWMNLFKNIVLYLEHKLNKSGAYWLIHHTQADRRQNAETFLTAQLEKEKGASLVLLGMPLFCKVQKK